MKQEISKGGESAESFEIPFLGSAFSKAQDSGEQKSWLPVGRLTPIWIPPPEARIRNSLGTRERENFDRLIDNSEIVLGFGNKEQITFHLCHQPKSPALRGLLPDASPFLLPLFFDFIEFLVALAVYCRRACCRF